MKTKRDVFWEWWQQCRAECEKFRHTVKLVTIKIPYYGDLYGYQFTYYGICMTTNSNQLYIFYPKTSCFYVLMAGTVDVAVRNWVYWALTKNMSGKQKEMHVFLFCCQVWSSVEGCSPNSSAVGPHGWYNWRSCQHLSLQSVSKNNERKTIKNARFSWFWALFVIKQWSREEGSSSNALGVGPNDG